MPLASKEEGRLDEAETLYWRVIEHQRDRNDPEALTSMNNVAVLLQAQGKLAEAESLLRQTLEQLKARFGADHGNFLRSQNSLACLLQNQGKYPEARRLYLQTVEAQRRTLGSDHLDTIATLENLATLLYEEDELESAEPLMHEAVVVRRRVLGDMHTDTLRSFNNLSLLLQKQGKTAQAEPLLRQTFAGQKRTLGDYHIETLTSMSNLAILLEDQNKLEEAEALHLECFKARQRHLGLAHHDTLTSANNLGSFYVAQGRFEEAQSIFSEALTLAQANFPKSHFLGGQLASALRSLLGWLQALLGSGKAPDRRLQQAQSRVRSSSSPDPARLLRHHRHVRRMGQARQGCLLPRRRGRLFLNCNPHLVFGGAPVHNRRPGGACLDAQACFEMAQLLQRLLIADISAAVDRRKGLGAQAEAHAQYIFLHGRQVLVAQTQLRNPWCLGAHTAASVAPWWDVGP